MCFLLATFLPGHGLHFFCPLLLVKVFPLQALQTSFTEAWPALHTANTMHASPLMRRQLQECDLVDAHRECLRGFPWQRSGSTSHDNPTHDGLVAGMIAMSTFVPLPSDAPVVQEVCLAPSRFPLEQVALLVWPLLEVWPRFLQTLQAPLPGLPLLEPAGQGLHAPFFRENPALHTAAGAWCWC